MSVIKSIISPTYFKFVGRVKVLTCTQNKYLAQNNPIHVVNNSFDKETSAHWKFQKRFDYGYEEDFF